jgi:hypothetical protein
MKKNILFLFFCMTIYCYGNNDKYRLILADDPATTITIAWDQISGTSPTVHYGTTDFGTDYLMYPNTQTEDRAIVYRGMDNRFVRLTGLTPNTNYYFVIHDNEGTSDRFWFRTAPNDLSRLSFIAGGDSRNNQVPRQNANLLVSKLKPHAVLFGGDMTDDDNDSQWQDWMDDWQMTTATDGRMFPIVPARGNPEGSNVIYNLFDTSTDDSYYAITFGNDLIRAYTLNTEISVSGNQLNWLESDLDTQSNVLWKMAQYHKPMRPHTAAKAEGNSQYNAWAQLFYEKAVRLVMDCDSHMVKTTWPVQPFSNTNNDEGFIQNDLNGTVYAGEGCWGAPLRLNDDDKEWTRNSGSFNQFKLIFIADSEIEMRTIKVDNAASVGEVSNTDPFALPANLDIWNPSEGDVVTILPAGEIVNPEIAFANGTSANYIDGANILLEVDVIDPGSGIDQVDFYVDSVLTETDTIAPYSFTNSYADGSFCVEAVATDFDSQVGGTKIYINIGVFTNSDSLPLTDGHDDVEETETGIVYFTSSDLEMVYDDFEFVTDVSNGYQKIGYRFKNLNIPSGAIIESAYIQFRSDEVDSDDAEFNIFAEASGNALPFEDDNINNVSGRPRVSGSVNWMPSPWTDTGLTGPEQQTPELKELLQQVIDGDDWEQGNSTVFMLEATGISLTDEDAKRVADSYEGSSSNPPTLVYTYSFNSALGMNDILQEVEINIFPNPFQSEFGVQLSSVLQENTSLEIFDIKGTIVYKTVIRNTNGGLQIIKPNITSNGMYFVVIRTEFGAIIETVKLLKQ